MERRIDEKFEYDNFEYQCLAGSGVKGERCQECCLRDIGAIACRHQTDEDIRASFGPCAAHGRIDGECVFFKKTGLAVRKNMKAFDLQAAKAGRRVCTRDGRPARVVCFDAKCSPPVIALITQPDGSECLERYYDDGRFTILNETESDLMMAPEYRHGWINIFMDEESYYVGDTVHYLNSQLFPTEEMALEYAKRSAKKLVATKEVRWEE